MTINFGDKVKSNKTLAKKYCLKNSSVLEYAYSSDLMKELIYLRGNKVFDITYEPFKAIPLSFNITNEELGHLIILKDILNIDGDISNKEQSDNAVKYDPEKGWSY